MAVAKSLNKKPWNWRKLVPWFSFVRYNLTAKKKNTNNTKYYTNSRDLQLLIDESFAEKVIPENDSVRLLDKIGVSFSEILKNCRGCCKGKRSIPDIRGHSGTGTVFLKLTRMRPLCT